MLFHCGFSVRALQSKLWRIKHEEVTLKNGWKSKILLLIIFIHLLLPWTYNQMHDAWFKLTCYHPPPPQPTLGTCPASFSFGPGGIVWGGPMRTLGLGNRPPSKKQNCKSWGVYQRRGGGGGEGFESCIIMMKTINLCLPDFFSYFTKI